MKIIRSTKCSLKFCTSEKKQKLQCVLNEYSKVVNIFINFFWSNPDKAVKAKLLKPIVDIPSDSWLSARLRKVAAREAIDMCQASWKRWKDKAVKPTHRGNRMCVSSTIADLQDVKNADGFDGWLHLASIGNKVILDLPIKNHEHFNKYAAIGKRQNAYIITDRYVQFSFEIETGAKVKITKVIGIDTGINALASISTENQYGLDIKDCIERIKRCKHGSKGQQRARRALRQRIDEVAKEVIAKEQPDMVVVERLNNLNKNSKVKGRLTKNIRSSIGSWNWRYWLNRIESQCQRNRISFRTVLPHYTSQRCPECDYTDRSNRKGEIFKCRKCGHSDNADINAAKNILNRLITAPYGGGCKPENLAVVKNC